MSPPRPSLSEAIGMVGDHARLAAPDVIPLDTALGRRLAEPVCAGRDYPAFDMSAMDGYAIRSDACAGPGTRELAIGPAQLAGAPATELRPGETRPVATGSMLLPDVGAVLVRERARLSGGALHLAEPLPLGMNIRRRGEDARRGEEVMAKGALIHPAAIGALASYGVTRVCVRKRPRIALLSSGDELRSAGTTGQGHVIDANGPMIAAMLRMAGCEVVRLPLAADDRASLAARFETAIAGGVDLIVSTGGVSVGDHDLIPQMVEAIGATVHFHGVHMRPGKPVLYASHPTGPAVFGLPGNPVAALVGARFLVMRAVRGLLGLGPETPLVFASEPPEHGVTRVLKARRAGHETVALGGQQSHVLRPLIEANAWLVTGDGRVAATYPLYDDLADRSASG